MVTVLAAEFTRNFSEYQRRAQTETVAVMGDGGAAGYFVSPEEFEALQHYRKQAVVAVRTVDLPAEMMAAISTARMDPRHAALDALLDPSL